MCASSTRKKYCFKARLAESFCSARFFAPCFAVCRPVCDLLRKDGKVPDETFRAVSGVFRGFVRVKIFSNIRSKKY